MTAKIAWILIVFMLVAPVVATVQYPEEYYTLSDQSKVIFDSVSQRASFYLHYDPDNVANVGSFYELRRQTILMEKQNELLQEQVDLLKKIAPEERIPERNITIEYCNTLNTSQCWDNISDIPSYSTEAYSWNVKGD